MSTGAPGAVGAGEGAGNERRTGLLFGVGAYTLWGLMPLYWALLHGTRDGELLAQRMVWALPTAALFLAVLGRWSWLRPLLRQPRRLALIAGGAAVISVNWFLYIYAVSHDMVIEGSLGYFINPLVSIAFGVLLLHERLRALQWVAVGIGALAVVVMTLAYGQLPWLSLGLALSFATYGLLKKHVGLGGVEGFSAESAIQFLPAAGYLGWLAARGESTFVAEGAAHTALLALSGLATALPLIFFGAAAVRLPLSVIGLLQYLAPLFMFVLGVFVFHEEMPPERLVGFALVWLALALLTWDALHTTRRGRAELRRMERELQERGAPTSTGTPETAEAQDAAEALAVAGDAERPTDATEPGVLSRGASTKPAVTTTEPAPEHAPQTEPAPETSAG